MGAWLESALLLAILLVIFVTTSAWNENGTFVRGCNFEVRNTTYENWSRTYSLLTIPPLKSIEYPNVESQFYWLSLSRIPEFEARDISIDVVERFCALPRSRYVYVSADTYERPDMAIINNIKLHLLAEPLESFHNDEEYILNINTTSISLSACSERGILYGLGTLGQLLESPNPIALPVTIHDWPELPWRGLLVDVVRHFIPVQQLLRAIDAMEAAKFNILHLHLTDSQYFPVLLRDTEDLQLSLLARRGAFMASHDIHGKQKRHMYTAEDLKTVVQYAAQRGIEVVPELDVPSHTRSWGEAYPELLVRCPSFASRQEHPVNVYTLNPTHPLALRIVEAIISQLVELFPSIYIHVGGDEVLTECWLEDDDMRIWRDEKNTSFEQMLSDFETAVFRIVRAKGKIPIGWQDLVDVDVYPPISQQVPTYGRQSAGDRFAAGSKESPSIVHAWKCWGGLAGKAAGRAALNGHNVITSACWYLDFDSDVEAFLEAQPIAAAEWAVLRAITGGARRPQPLQSSTCIEDPGPEGGVCESLPNDYDDTPRQTGRVWGGEAAVWTEGIDFTNFDCRVWPRAGAVSTSLWGYKDRSVVVKANKSYTQSPREDGYNILSSYVRFSNYLRRFHVIPADISLHTVSPPTSLSRSPSVNPVGSLNESAIHALLRHRVELTKNGVKFHGIKMVSQCPALDEAMLRPINLDRDNSRYVKIVQLNIAEGGGGHRRVLLHDWFRNQAMQGVSFIGLCELNMWHVIESHTNANANFPVIRSRAARAGFAYSHILHSELHPYNVGIVSALPFEVLGEYGPPDFQRGVLHVYFESLGLHAFIAHLHAHNSTLRELEAKRIAQLAEPYLDDRLSHKVVVMGDLNSLYSKDKTFHDEDDLLGMFQRTNHSVYSRLKKKFCNSSGTGINYEPLNILVDVGLRESCTEHCDLVGDAVRQAACREEKCALTLPTRYNPEWPAAQPMPKMRLDYILVNNNVLAEKDFKAGVDVSDITMDMSDHFPVYVSWTQYG